MSKFRRKRLHYQGIIRSSLYKLRRNQLVKALSAIFLVVLVSAVGVTFLEYESNASLTDFGKGMWWALVTMTTVGYGDIVPMTVAGRILAGFVMLSGIALVSVFTAAVSSRVITNRLKEGKGLSKVKGKGHIAVLGWNSSCEDVIRSLHADAIRDNRSIVLINQMNPDIMEPITHKFTDLQVTFVFGDPTDETILRRANIDSAYAAIIVPDESLSGTRSDERTLLTTLSVKAIESRVRVIAHIIDASNAGHLKRANADQVVISDSYGGYLLGAHVNSPGIPEMLDLLLSADSPFRFSRKKIPHSLQGQSFAELSDHFKKSENILAIGVITEEPGFSMDDMLSEDYSAIDAFIRQKLASAGKGLSKESRLKVQLNPPADYEISNKDVAIVIERLN